MHHLALAASDFERSERMYAAALSTLGIRPLYRNEGVAEFWSEQEDRLSFSLEQARRPDAVTRRMHIAFAAADRAEVDRFHAAAVEAGARSRYSPRFWPEYRAYCAFIRDPDGNNIEAVHKQVGPSEG